MADRLTIEHYIGECFYKCAQVVLASRVLTCSGPRDVQLESASATSKRSSRWFNLEVPEVDGLTQAVDVWRKGDFSEPLVLEVLAQPWEGRGIVTGAAAAIDDAAGGLLLERWVLRYSPPASGSSSGSSSQGSSTRSTHMGGQPGSAGSRTYIDEASVYKRMVILIRALYSYVRVLPAFRMHRTSKRLSAEPVTIRWRVHGGPGSRSPIRSMSSLSTSSHAQGHGGGHHAHGQHGPDHGHSHGQHGSGCAAASHLTRAASTSPAAAALLASMGAAATAPPRMQQFLFAPIDAPGGMQLQLTVEYAATAQLHILQVPSAPISVPAVHIIHDYLSAPNRQDSNRNSLQSGSGATHGSILAHGPHAQHLHGHSLSTAGSMPSWAHGNSSGGDPCDPSGGNRPMGPPSTPGVIRTSWSSKDMKVSFSLPGSAGFGGQKSPGGPRLRRQGSGYGSPHATGMQGRPSASPPTPGHGSMAHVVGSIGSGSSVGNSGRPPLPRTDQRSKLPTAALGSSPSAPAPQRRPAVADATGGASQCPLGNATAVVSSLQHAGSRQGGAGTVCISSSPGKSQAQAAAGQGMNSASRRPELGGNAGLANASASGTREGLPAAAAATPLRSTPSGPLDIPIRSTGRTQSAADLQAPVQVYDGFDIKPATAAAAGPPGCASSVSSMQGSGSQRRNVDRPRQGTDADDAGLPPRFAMGSAPAAPRGMLGLALCAAAKDTRLAHASSGSSGGGHASSHGQRLPAQGSAAAAHAAGSIAAAAAPFAFAAEGQQHAQGQGGPDTDANSGQVNNSSTMGLKAASAVQNEAAVVPSSGGSIASSSSAVRPRHGSSGGSVDSSNGSKAIIVHSGVSSSPQLPFACTPSGASSASLYQALGPLPGVSLQHPMPPRPHSLGPHALAVGLPGHTAESSSSGALVAAGTLHGVHGGGVVNGRDISMLAAIRRPSWSSRSSSYDPAMLALLSAGMGAHGGAFPALSPDPLLSLPWSHSTSHAASMGLSPPASVPHNTLMGPCRLVGSSGQGMHAGKNAAGSDGIGSGAPAHRPDSNAAAAKYGTDTSPAWTDAIHGGLLPQNPICSTAIFSGLHAEDSEGDLLPFALDSDGLISGSPKLQYSFAARSAPGARMHAALHGVPGNAVGGALDRQGTCAGTSGMRGVMAGAAAAAAPGQLPQGTSREQDGAADVLLLTMPGPQEQDVAVGAFIRMLVDATSLAFSGGDSPGHPIMATNGSPTGDALQAQGCSANQDAGAVIVMSSCSSVNTEAGAALAAEGPPAQRVVGGAQPAAGRVYVQGASLVEGVELVGESIEQEGQVVQGSTAMHASDPHCETAMAVVHEPITSLGEGGSVHHYYEDALQSVGGWPSHLSPAETVSKLGVLLSRIRALLADGSASITP